MTKTQFKDLRKDYFYSQQAIYGLGKHWTDYEDAALATALTISLPIDSTKQWRVYFETQGLSNVYTRNLSDLWYEYLGGLGFTGTLLDRLRAFYISGTAL